jgi:hypothetical protein
MQTKKDEKKLEGNTLMEFPCDSCHLIQRYRGPSQVKCIYCGSPVKQAAQRSQKNRKDSSKP